MNNFLPVFTKITGYLPYIAVMRPKIYYENKALQSRKIRGAAIVMPDHHMIWDVATLMHVFPSRNMRCIISEVICTNKAVAFFVKHMGYIIADRECKDFSFLSKAEDVLEKNGVVEIYPESRLPRPGEETPLPFKPSVTYLALHSGAPIIPVVTNGSFAKKERMRVLIGAPIDVRELYDTSMGERENIDNITNILRNKIIELKYELERQRSGRSAAEAKKTEDKRVTV